MRATTPKDTPPPITVETSHITHLEVTKDLMVSVGSGGVEKIEPYNEPGGLGPVLAFAVYVNGVIASRYNWLQCVAVHYAPKTASVKESSGEQLGG